MVGAPLGVSFQSHYELQMPLEWEVRLPKHFNLTGHHSFWHHSG